MQVVVVMEEGGEYDMAYSTIYGVYKDIKAFHDEARLSGFLYDNDEKCFYSIDKFGDVAYYVENIFDLKGE